MSSSISKQAEDIHQIIDTVDCVSFDLFDTLVFRKSIFFPKDVFTVVEIKAITSIGKAAIGFALKREQAESAARSEANCRNESETTFSEIYSQLSRRMSLSKRQVSQLHNLELDCEREVLERNEQMAAYFDYAISKKKKVIISTDTYFDDFFILEICKRLGFGKATLFVSSAYGKSKQDGTLFEVIIRDMHLPSSRILHIGDNTLSDITMPLLKGIRVRQYRSKKQQFQQKLILQTHTSCSPKISKILCDISDNFSNNYYGGSNNIRVSEQIGTYLGFLLLGFTFWLDKQIEELAAKKVFFLARDGQILKRFFDLYAHSSGRSIDTHYLHVSRTSLYPSLIFSDPKNARSMFTHSWANMTIGGALSRLSLSFNEYRDTIVRYGFYNADQRLNASNRADFRAFMVENWEDIELQNHKNYTDLVEYLNQEEFFLDPDSIVVDLGWHLSLQFCLSKLATHLEFSSRVHGLYMGVFSNKFPALKSNANAFLVNQDQPSTNYRMVRSGPSLIELLHGADHGTVLGYERKDGGIQAIHEQNSVEKNQYDSTIRGIQSVALNFFSSAIEKFDLNSRLTLNPDLYAAVGLKMIYNPSRDEAELLGKLKHSQDFHGKMCSITGTSEYDLSMLKTDTLPDGTIPLWRPGFEILKGI